MDFTMKSGIYVSICSDILVCRNKGISKKFAIYIKKLKKNVVMPIWLPTTQ
jgi:hypothetical protein